MINTCMMMYDVYMDFIYDNGKQRWSKMCIGFKKGISWGISNYCVVYAMMYVFKQGNILTL